MIMKWVFVAMFWTAAQHPGDDPKKIQILESPSVEECISLQNFTIQKMKQLQPKAIAGTECIPATEYNKGIYDSPNVIHKHYIGTK